MADFNATWNSAITYTRGDYVQYGGSSYFLKESSSLNERPDLNLTKWIKVETPSAPSGTSASTSTSVVTQGTKGSYSAPSVVTVGTTSVTALAANNNRIRAVLANEGTTRIYIGVGITPSATVHHHVLLPASAAHGGDGSALLIDNTTQVVNAISSANGGILEVTEIA